MARSFLALIALCAALSLGGCSFFRRTPPKATLPVVAVRTATMDVTPGIKVMANLRLPAGFVPNPAREPMWLQNGTEVAVIGAERARTEIYGYSGPGWKNRRLIAADRGPGARDGVIVDVAADQNGMSLAYAVHDPGKERIEVVVRDLIAAGDGHPVATFYGDFASASVAWLNPVTIALALRDKPVAADAQPANPQEAKPARSKPGLYVIGINGMVTAEFEAVKCPLSPLVWGPRRLHAVGQGDRDVPPILLTREGPSCEPLFAQGPIRVIAWSPDGSSFLYVQRGIDGVESTYRYWIGKNVAPALTVVSSKAAAFTSAGDVLALGNSGLTFGAASRFPNRPIRAELALSHASRHELDVVSLGFKTTPALLAESTMAYSQRSDRAAMDTFLPTKSGVFRRIITYSLATQSAFVVAYGPARGPVEMSWSPAGKYLALVDDGGEQAVLTIMEPPQ